MNVAQHRWPRGGTHRRPNAGAFMRWVLEWSPQVRILYTAVDTPVPGTHGGSVHVFELCRALGEIGHEVHLVAPPGAAAAADETPRRHHISRPPRFLEWSCVDQVRAIGERVKPDVVVDRFYTFGGAGIWAARKLGTPAVLEVNSPARPYPGSWRDRLDRLSLIRPVDRWRRRVLAWSDAIYTTSAYLVPPEIQDAVTVVTNGVDTLRFRPGPVPTGPLRCVYAAVFGRGMVRKTSWSLLVCASRVGFICRSRVLAMVPVSLRRAVWLTALVCPT